MNWLSTSSFAVILCLFFNSFAFARAYANLPLDGGIHHLRLSKDSDTRENRFSISVPSSFDARRKRPLLVVLHGGKNSGEKYIEDWAREIGKDDVVVLAPSSSKENGKWAFSDSDQILRFISKVKDRYRIDPKRVYIVGFSSGGWMASYMGLRYPYEFRAVASIEGRLNAAMIRDAARSSRSYPDFYIIAGIRDESIPIEDIREGVKQMKAAGLGVRFEEFDTTHHSPLEFLILILDWLDQFNKK